MKKLTTLALTLLLIAALSLTACAQSAGRVFTDSTGREVTVDQEISRIAVTGPLGQIVVFAIAPDMLVGIPGAWNPEAKAFLDEQYYSLPVLGQLYGGKGDLNLEELLKAAPQVVIDIGEPKGSIAEDMDALTEQTGIPFVHISAYLESMDETYTMLGELLGLEEAAGVLAETCTRIYSRAVEMMQGVEKVNMLYVTGENGLNVLANGGYHSGVIDMMANNVAVVENVSSKGTGNEVDMEQILNWNPDVIVFSENSIYDTVGEDPVWQNVSAIANNRYYEVPFGPYNWIGQPPAVQRLLGMMWLGKLLYPEAATYDLYDEVAQYYQLFYHCDLTREQYDALMAKAIDK
ncbi:MAG: ABC transporter substrate-binding protein [Candidatus Ventricola sp.]|nr:ABC transporter substrate-binding protein [Candidatus Ventricola sp.]